jgi:DNA-binding transcriptional LysR family regulator
MDELFARESVPRRIRAETPLSEIACAMVSSGQGISVVDPFTAREFERRGVVARRFLPAVEFQVTLLYSRRRGLSPLAREFAEAVERSIREFKREFAVAR